MRLKIGFLVVLFLLSLSSCSSAGDIDSELNKAKAEGKIVIYRHSEFLRKYLFALVAANFSLRGFGISMPLRARQQMNTPVK